jgi:hypothetical protein
MAKFKTNIPRILAGAYRVADIYVRFRKAWSLAQLREGGKRTLPLNRLGIATNMPRNGGPSSTHG